LAAKDLISRRRLVGQLALAASLVTASRPEPRAADLPLISESDPQAKAVKYVEDATKVSEAKANRCSTCASYTGVSGSTQGGCRIFDGKLVKAAGWCASWAPQI
jgi:hypothetical protein